MTLIAHRGNLTGPNPDRENSPDYIDEAIAQRFSVEVDLWKIDDELYLGHDDTQYKVSLEWIKQRQEHLWIHCKNSWALDSMLKNNLHCFWHDTDDYTMTSKNYVWTYPGKPIVGYMSICVLPERHINIFTDKLPQCFGVCSDYVMNIRNL